VPDHLVSLAVAVVSLTGISVGVGRWAGLGQVRDVVVASARAVVQLAAVGVVIGVVFRTPRLAPIYLLVVLGAAGYTSSRRLPGVERALMTAAVSIGTSSAVCAAVVLGSGALAWEPRSAVPFLVQLMGGAMTATSLAGQRMIDDVGGGWAEVEGWLALGATSRQAVAQQARRAAARALVPALDQTRNVGLVVLPGAYVGLLLGGASPVEAGRLQLLVLVGLLATETIAAVTVTRLLSARLGARKPQ
jgi:putative ABC transport system permease protein